MFRKIAFCSITVASIGGYAFAQQRPAPPQENQIRQIFVEPGNDGYVGVQLVDVSKENFAKFGLSDVKGAAIEKVQKDSPAEKAGLKDGDVVLKFNGEDVTSVRKLQRLISETAPDHKAQLSIARDGQIMDVDITIEKRKAVAFTGAQGNLRTTPDFPTLPGFPNFGSEKGVFVVPGERAPMIFSNPRGIGVGVTPITKQLAEKFGVSGGEGLLITEVLENSAADKAGLKAGDVITQADGKNITGIPQFQRAISAKESGDVTLTIVRDKAQITLNVTPEKQKARQIFLEDKNVE